MNSLNKNGLLQILFLVLYLNFNSCEEENKSCHPVPLNSKTEPLRPDNRFALEIEDVGSTYIPNTHYKVKLYAKDGQSTFRAFTIYATGEETTNPNNPRLKQELPAGNLYNFSSYAVVKCQNTIIQADINPKTSVVIDWLSPPKYSKCVTISAKVAVKPDVWYSPDGPLSKRICEDLRKKEDMMPPENSDCRVCEDARYELEFQGTWSYNTHPSMFPEKQETAKFSDIVGASHNKKYNLFLTGDYATDGLKMLAEQGNTTTLEHEILKYLGRDVRTVIKATRPLKPSLSTVSSFRATSEHHFISIAASIIPSPDWFLGVNLLELCDNTTGNWTNEYILNLYPLDAGTDSGTEFDSPSDPTTPAQTIQSREVSSADSKKPFARIKVTLVRTYETPKCSEKTNTPSKEEENPGIEIEPEEKDTDNTRPEVETSPSPPVIDSSESDDECQVTAWGSWSPCEGPCGDDNKILGYQMRLRHFVVNGHEIDFSDEDDEEVPEACTAKEVNEMQKCEADCEVEKGEEIPDAQQGNWEEWSKPGQSWRRWP